MCSQLPHWHLSGDIARVCGWGNWRILSFSPHPASREAAGCGFSLQRKYCRKHCTGSLKRVLLQSSKIRLKSFRIGLQHSHFSQLSRFLSCLSSKLSYCCQGEKAVLFTWLRCIKRSCSILDMSRCFVYMPGIMVLMQKVNSRHANRC